MTEISGSLDLVTPGLDDILGAIDLHRLHGLSCWDALVARALVQGCDRLFSGDLQPGCCLDGLTAVNPFA